MVLDPLAPSVAARHMLAKGMSLVPDFQTALNAYKQGEPNPIMALLQRVVDTILPGGERPPSWFNALGTAKRNALLWLYREGSRLREMVSPAHQGQIHDAEKWRAYVVMELETWGKKLRTLEIASQAGEEERAIKHGGFTIVPMPGVSKTETDAALEALDAASEKIRSKFPQVLYGNVFFSTHLSATTAAHYVYGDDTIHLSVRARKRFNDIYTLIHEFGHRFDHKFFTNKELRNRFWDLSTRKVYERINFDDRLRQAVADELVGVAKARKEGKTFTPFSPEAEMWVKELHDVKGLMSAFLSGKLDESKLHAEIKGHQDKLVMTGKVQHGPLAVTPYGATKPTENFAEAFAHMVLGMAMPPELAEIMAKL
jgi:hypothetical protein